MYVTEFAKNRSYIYAHTHSIFQNLPCELANNTKLTSFTVLCLVSLVSNFIPKAQPQTELCVFKVIKLDVQIRPVFAGQAW